jgi:hypothetical protein
VAEDLGPFGKQAVRDAGGHLNNRRALDFP